MIYNDETLLNNKVSESEVQKIVEKYGKAFKESRLNPSQELEYGQVLLQSPFEQDLFIAITIFEELIRNRRNELNMVLEYYVGLIIGFMKVKKFEDAIMKLDLCRQLIHLNIEQENRLKMLENRIQNRNRSFFWAAASFVAGVGAIALMVISGKKS
ncbi:uncharacterized protein LOC124494562 [Dermatophagoides farinae]|uniref:uncharacterized protein LOC124494562 n=1 Tax=Dermatophagoides farinae TaxID=6954 RepID=UPI003F62ABF1